MIYLCPLWAILEKYKHDFGMQYSKIEHSTTEFLLKVYSKESLLYNNLRMLQIHTFDFLVYRVREYNYHPLTIALL